MLYLALFSRRVIVCNVKAVHGVVVSDIAPYAAGVVILS